MTHVDLEHGDPISPRKDESADSESVGRHDEEMQEQVAKDMILLTKSLRDNSIAAQRIIQDDNDVSVWLLPPGLMD